MATEKERQEFIARFCAEYTGRMQGEAPGRTARRKNTLTECIDAARALLRHARTHGNLAVQYCNGPEHLNAPAWYNHPHRQLEAEAWEAQRERKELACEKCIKEICAAFNLPVAFGGDPRGFTVKLKLPSGASNTWGGSEEGYGVPQ